MTSSVRPGAVKPRHILSNTGWNILGRVAPVFVALLVTPKLIHLMGLSRWGLFTIALSLVGSFGIFDLGLGRALTRAIADGVSNDADEKQIADLSLTGTVTLGIIGFIGGLIAAVAVQIWVSHGLKIPEELKWETRLSLWVLCATGPLLLINAAMWGIMSAYQAFRTVSLVSVPISVMYYLGPLIMLLFWNSLIGVMLSLAVCRLWMTVAYLRICLNLMPALRTARIRPVLLKPLLRIGGWMTISNLAYPILIYFDRFVIASVVSVAATAFYTTPLDVVSRFAILTNAVAGSAFPAFSSSWRNNIPETVELFRTSLLVMTALMFPVCFWSALFSHAFLVFWIDPLFAVNSTLIMKLLCLGVFAGALDTICAGFLDAIGRPDTSARLSLGELCVYLPILFLCVKNFGIVGAAAVWALRCLIDVNIRMAICLTLYKPLRQGVISALPVIAAAFLCMGAALFNFPMLITLPAALIVPLLLCALLWCACMNTHERKAFKAVLARLTARVSRSRPA
ncbi:flippase [Acetobacter oeni]|uniref:Putative O-antigen transporter n=1 Tax=Acetobacter oeni TaxID=304077 RepID=A0A511XHU5_9PROT|nr:flippase [Acetobacter oeni]MBB3882548.1 O-antigen/teichoic acid export membrane protein [Acetobacter oeni]NHO18640.1 oligosaccharide flippase family protein [Acetobacter oeni]GBR11924.1 polysaccharide biosynthesis protein [Acetobacter oeni LMG 21952]GEN62514.1 putative O-antigen transporter [Acetobacter oeni]